MYNNLFQYATSELSQDAFICWLLSYAVKGCDKDKALSECAKEFLRFFIPELKNEDVYLSEVPRKQYKSIDVLITVNDKYKIIIEDKTHTSDHDNQLLRYRETVNKDFPEYKCIGVYYKIGFQSSMYTITEAEYIVCDREKILSILEKYIDKTQNSIFIDYYEYLKNFNDRANSFKSMKISEWGWEQINGFYKYCQEVLADTGLSINFSYIHNQTGGFYGMWLCNDIMVKAAGLECEAYLQCNFTKGALDICYRASSKTEKIKREHRDALVWKQQEDGSWVNIAKEHNFNKPKRYGAGKSVAIGVYNQTPTNYVEAIEFIRKAIQDFYNLMEEIKSF